MFVFLGALLPMAAQAGPLPPTPATAPLIIDQGRSDRIQPSTLPEDLKTQPRPGATVIPPSVDAQGSGVPIRGIAFEGVEVPAIVADAARRFIGQPATRATLGKLAEDLAAAYEKSGIALYTIAVPDQDLSTGQVRLQIAEGFVEDVVYPTDASPLLRRYAERLQRETPLTRATLERYLSLMRDIPGGKIDVELRRGAKAGGVVLALTSRRERWDFSLGVDNRRTQGLGSGQIRAEARAFSLLRDGDRTEVTALAATDLKRFRYVAVTHSTPLGSDGLSLGLSAGHLETRPRDALYTGEADTAGISISYPIIRGYRRNLSASIGVDGINSDAAAFGALISSDRTRTARLAAGYSEVGSKSVLTGGLTVSRGLDILGARETAGFTDATFTKINGRATWDRMFGKKLVLRLRMSGQFSRDRLVATERFAAGGTEFGRAFDAAVLSGDRGIAGLAEIGFRPKLPAKLEGTELYGFVDGADIHIRSRTGFNGASYDLASAGGGIRIVYGARSSIEVEGARVIDDPYPGYRENWRFNLGWRLSLRK